MYRNAYQRGMLTIFYSCGSKPLQIWDTCTQDGYISRFLDPDIKSMVLEIGGTNVTTSYIMCPKGKQVLGITMPFLVMIVKNLHKYFTFEITILDETGTRRRFRVSNFQSTTQIGPLCTVMPIGLSDGWNQVQFNLNEFTRRAYQKQFVEVQKVKINANIRLRRIYFAERLVPEDELPAEYKLYFPLASKGAKHKKRVGDEKAAEASKASASQQTAPQRPPSAEVIKESPKASVHSMKESPSKESKSKASIEAAAIITEETEGGEPPAGADEQDGGETPAEGIEGGEIPKEKADGGEGAEGEGVAPEETETDPKQDAVTAEAEATDQADEQAQATEEPQKD